MTRRAWVGAPLALALAFCWAGCGQDEALVGGGCADGYTQCGSSCVNLASDRDNCGACGGACAASAECVQYACRASSADGSPDADDGGGLADATVDAAGDAPTGDATGDASTTDSTPTDSSSADAPSSADAEAGSDGSQSADASPEVDAPAADVVSPDGSASDAGGSEGASGDGAASQGDATVEAGTDGGQADSAADDGATDGSSGQGSEAGDAGSCAPLASCGGSCVDTTQNPDNCGGCGITCYSGICTGSACVGAAAGSVVYVGHDFESYSPAQARLLLNAMLLAQGQTVPVLSYERYASAAALTGIRAIVASSSAQIGRSISLTETTVDSDVPSTLTVGRYGVLLVPDQPLAASGALASLGGSYSTTLARFTRAGGIVVILDGDTGVAEMPSFVSATGLLSVTGAQQVAVDTALDVAARTDAVAVGVGTTYAAGAASASFTAEAAGGNVVYVVMTPGDVAPVVIHKVF